MEEIITQHPARGIAGPLKRVRSTLLLSGISEFRSRSLFDAYSGNLEPAARAIVLSAVVGEWLPLDVAMAHFQACDALGVSDDEAFAVGQASGKRIQQSVLYTLVRLAAGAGTTPWTVFDAYGRLWSRIFDGGSFVIVKLGPKEARVDCLGLAPVRFPYFRHAFRGANYAGLSLFSKSMFIREVPPPRGDLAISYRLSWA